MAKFALLIGVSEYEQGLTPLLAAINDVEAMQRILQHPEIGGFDEVKPLFNPERQAMEEAIETLFSGRQKDDLVLLFFSGHGIKDESGKLYFATRNTRKTDKGELVRSTAVAASFVHDIMSNSRPKPRQQVVILDCCFSGAFAEGMSAKSAKDDGFVDVKNQLGQDGRAVLTSSTSTQYSFEQQGADISTYTRYIVEGLGTGAADRDQDGWISVDELHEYAKQKVQEVAPAMKPEIYAIKEGYKIKLAQAPIGDPKLIYRREVEYWVKGGDGEISFTGRTTLDEKRNTLGLPSEETAAIEAQVLEPIKVYKQKLQRYEQALRTEIERGFPFSDKTRVDLTRLQQASGLRDEDIALVEAPIIAEQQKNVAHNTNIFSWERPYLPAGIGAIFGIFLFVSFSIPIWYTNSYKCPFLIWYINRYKCPVPPEITSQRQLADKFAEVRNLPEGTFKYGGSTSWTSIYPKLESEIKNAHRQFDIKVREDLVKGSGIGIHKLIDGGQDGLDFALSSRLIRPDEEKLAKEKGFTLEAIPVATSGLAVAVNPKLEINSLTKEQLSRIFSGEYDNWKRVGALADIPIKLYMRGNNSGSTEEFKKSLGIKEFAKKINYVNRTSEALQQIAKEPGGIFVSSASKVVPQCTVKTLPLVNKEGKIVPPYQQKNFVQPTQCRPGNRNRVNIEAIYSGEYPLTHDLYVVVKRNGQTEEQAGQAYANLLLTKQGQKMIKSLQETGILDQGE
ncbi:extracellular ligand-binding receptor [Kalymmatonema gypsitolerans NIES-4073]|nr:extracellular ligand-binding receptor [Scytonema sp. NIES-4073]